MRITAIGIGLVVAGIGIFGFTLVRLINGSAIAPQTQVPGTVTVEIDQDGRYFLWDNHKTMFNGEKWKYPADCPGDAQIIVRDSDGTEIEFFPDTSQNWSIGNHQKTSIGYIDVPTAGTLQIQVDGVKRDRIVTVSNRTMKQELWERLGGLGLGIIVGFIGVLIALLGLFLGRKSSGAAADSPIVVEG